MAHRLNFKDRKASMAFVEEVPWHGLGQRLKKDSSIEEWVKAANLDWEVKKIPVEFASPIKAEMAVFPGKFVLARSDNGFPLSICSKIYKVVQPSQILEFHKKIIEKYGGFYIETAGVLLNGEKIWVMAKAEDKTFSLAGDKILRYLLVATSYDLSFQTQVKQTSVRVVCHNTLDAAQGTDHATISIPHRSEFNFDAVEQRMAFDEEWKGFRNLMTKLSRKKVEDKIAKKFFKDLWFPPDSKKLDQASERSVNRQVDKMMTIYRTAPGQDLPSSRNTAFGLLNAVTYYADHKAKAQGSDYRLNSAWFGQYRRIKDQAVSVLQNMVN